MGSVGSGLLSLEAFTWCKASPMPLRRKSNGLFEESALCIGRNRNSWKDIVVSSGTTTTRKEDDEPPANGL